MAIAAWRGCRSGGMPSLQGGSSWGRLPQSRVCLAIITWTRAETERARRTHSRREHGWRLASMVSPFGRLIAAPWCAVCLMWLWRHGSTDARAAAMAKTWQSGWSLMTNDTLSSCCGGRVARQVVFGTRRDVTRSPGVMPQSVAHQARPTAPAGWGIRPEHRSAGTTWRPPRRWSCRRR
jgi:hypothetical protein